MSPRVAIIAALILSVSCNKSTGGDVAGGSLASASGSAAKAGSSSGGGGFSADLAKEIGAGSAARPDGSAGAKAGADAVNTGSAPSAPSTAGNAGAPVGSDPRPAARDASKAAGSDASKAAGSDAPKAEGDATKTGGGATRAGGDATKAGSNAIAAAGTTTKPDRAAKTGSPGGATGNAPESHGSVKVPADLAAIKMSLLPNWDRDIDEAGTFQYVVRIKGTQSTKTFSFHYGYDDPKAPIDHEQYKKYLQDSKVMLGEIKDRQRGSAWFLEATDGSGLPAFRYVILYGGKHLICYGSLYKDAESSRLGDDRDQTVIQAKQICETLAL